MESRISIIALGVSDLERSVLFYRDGLGFPTKYQESDGVAFFSAGGVLLELYPLDKLCEDISPDTPIPPPGFGGITLAHNTRTKEEVAEVLALAQSAGGKILKTAQDVFWGGRSGYFADPDGHVWEVAWGPMFKFAEDGSISLEG
jgi:Lactoylglutathione lyase and related lyases